MAAIGIAAAALLFIVGILVVRPFAIGFDEAKYLGIGANIWSGRGPYTAFGTLFLLHSPAWMTVLYAPQALVGLDAVTWGRALNGVAGLGVVVLTGLMARRSSPTAGVVAAFAMLSFTYLFLLSRTTRLDVPAAALALLYLEVGWQAISRGSVRWGIAAGLTFVAAVLVKEVAIPLAPVPILCGVLAGVAWPRLLRTGAWITIAASLGLAPWFIYYAAETGRVYRAETPAWTLPLLLLPIALVVVVGFLAGPVARSSRYARLAAATAARIPGFLRRHARALIGWGVTLAWSGAFLFFFSRISRLKGGPLIDVAQFRLYAHQWIGELAPFIAFCAIGGAMALLMLAVDRTARERRGVVNALVATICGAPLVLMVAAVGEPPRNYIAQVGIAVALASAGWTWAAAALVDVVGRRSGRTLGHRAIAVIAVIAVVAGSIAFGARAWATRVGSGGASGAAIETTADWIRTNVPPGTPIAFGSFLSYEMAYQLVADYPTYQVRHRIATVDPSFPMGFRRASEDPADDWVAADIAPRNVNEYQAFRASWIEELMRRWNIGYWVYTTGVSTSAASILPQLTPDHGFEPVAAWTFGEGTNERQVAIFKVDPDRVALDRNHLYLSPQALHRLVAELESAPDAARPAAQTLATRVVVIEPTDASDADLARLRALAGP
jgi:hypothetical protein